MITYQRSVFMQLQGTYKSLFSLLFNAMLSTKCNCLILFYLFNLLGVAYLQCSF